MRKSLCLLQILLISAIFIGQPSFAEAVLEKDEDGWPTGRFILERSDMEDCVQAQEENRVLEEKVKQGDQAITEWNEWAEKKQKELLSLEKEVKFWKDATVVAGVSGAVLSAVCFFAGVLIGSR